MRGAGSGPRGETRRFLAPGAGPVLPFAAMRLSLLGVLALLAAPLTLPTDALGQGMEAELKDLTWVGFQQFEEASRVFVRTSDKVTYRVDSSRETMVVLMLENTRIPLKNNRRPLPTQFFDSPVLSIVAKPIEGPSQSVDVEIRLRRKVPFQVSQNDTVVALDFNR